MGFVSCLECGNPVSEDDPICSRCGRPLSAGPIRTVSPASSLATIGQRVLARGIDVVLVYLTATVVSLLLSGVVDVGPAGLGTAVVAVFVVVWVAYFTTLEASGGRTPGKAAVGLTVTGGDHVSPVAPIDALVRNLVLVIPLLWFVALGGMAVDPVRRQGFHDRLVGTVVVYTG
jgi:uncharacterized RDD family membrane protein YckC